LCVTIMKAGYDNPAFIMVTHKAPCYASKKITKGYHFIREKEMCNAELPQGG